MKNSNVPAKSRGILLFAFNTELVDYVKIAEHAARLIHHTLNLPVTLVTDLGTVTEHFDTTIYVENTIKNFRTGYAGGSDWRNCGRYQAYELSPYDETLLLDSDYLMLDTSLLKILDTVSDYAIASDSQNTKQSMNSPMGQLDFVWATAVAFKRTAKSELLFSLVRRIQNNYGYYRKLYNIPQRNFRNDYAFAIADNILNGYTKTITMPWPMLTLDEPITAIEIQEHRLVVREQDRAHLIPKQNIHVIDKDYLLSDQYSKFVDQICQN